MPTRRMNTVMTTNITSNNRNQPGGGQYILRRELDNWHLTFEGRQAVFKHELGALYTAHLLVQAPRRQIHAVLLALEARKKLGQPAGPEEALEERSMGLGEAAAVRALWLRQRDLERTLADRLEIEPVKAEVQRELEEVTEYLRQSPWLSRHGAERSTRAVASAIKRFHGRLAGAVDSEGKANDVLRAFAVHLQEYLLVPSGRGGAYAKAQAVATVPGSLIYLPPPHVVWNTDCGVRAANADTQCSTPRVRRSKSNTNSSEPRRLTAVEYLSRFLCVAVALGLFGTGCASRPLKGGKAATTRLPAGVIEQTVVQGENASQATKQDQETVKVRSYTVPAGSRLEEPRVEMIAPGIPLTNLHAVVLSAPMPVVEREETRARTELGAAQKDTARELGARLSSLKGIVWVGVGLFVFGLASLVYPPLKMVVASVTTSAALMLGGVTLMVLPTMVVGNELLILGVVALAVGGWFLAHRHGELRGSLKSDVQSPKSGASGQ